METYYHGSSTACAIDYVLLPPSVTDTLSEEGRKKNLDRVFFTRDRKSADVYAGRAVNRFGGSPVVYRVIPMGRDTVQLNGMQGTTVFHASWAFVEKIS